MKLFVVLVIFSLNLSYISCRPFPMKQRLNDEQQSPIINRGGSWIRGLLTGRRTKRSSDNDRILKKPFYTQPITRVYLQRGQTYQIPCPVWTKEGKFSVFLWYKEKELLVRETTVKGDTNYTHPSGHYHLSRTDYGLIISQVEQTDGGRYTCKIIPYESSRSRMSSADAIVLDKQFPSVDDISAKGEEQNLTLAEQHYLSCPAELPENENDRATVYWSLDTGMSNATSIIGVRFSDLDTVVIDGYHGEYNVTANGSLVINSLQSNYSRFWWHLSGPGTPLRSGYIDVNGIETRSSSMHMVPTTDPGFESWAFLGLLPIIAFIACLTACVSLFVRMRSKRTQKSPSHKQDEMTQELQESNRSEGHQDETEMANTEEDCDESSPLTNEAPKIDSAGASAGETQPMLQGAIAPESTKPQEEQNPPIEFKPTKDVGQQQGESSSSGKNTTTFNIFFGKDWQSMRVLERLGWQKSPNKASTTPPNPNKVTPKRPGNAVRRVSPKSKWKSLPKKSAGSKASAGETQSIKQTATVPERVQQEEEQVPRVEVVQTKDKLPHRSAEQQRGILLADRRTNDEKEEDCDESSPLTDEAPETDSARAAADAESIKKQQALHDSETSGPGETSPVEEETLKTESVPTEATEMETKTPTETMETEKRENKANLTISDEEEGVKTPKHDVRKTTDTTLDLESNRNPDQAGEVDNCTREQGKNLPRGKRKVKEGKRKENRKEANSKKKSGVAPIKKTKSPGTVSPRSTDGETAKDKIGSQSESQLQPGDNAEENQATVDHQVTPKREQPANEQVVVNGPEDITTPVRLAPPSSGPPLPSTPQTNSDHLEPESGEKPLETKSVGTKKKTRQYPCLTVNTQTPSPATPANQGIDQGGDVLNTPMTYPAAGASDVATTEPSHHPSPTAPIAAVKPFTSNDTAARHNAGSATAETPVPPAMPNDKNDAFEPMNNIGSPQGLPVPPAGFDNIGTLDVSAEWERSNAIAGSPQASVPSENPIPSDDESMNGSTDGENDVEDMEASPEHPEENGGAMEVESTDEEMDRPVKTKKPIVLGMRQKLRNQNPHKQEDIRMKRYQKP